MLKRITSVCRQPISVIAPDGNFSHLAVLAETSVFCIGPPMRSTPLPATTNPEPRRLSRRAAAGRLLVVASWLPGIAAATDVQAVSVAAAQQIVADAAQHDQHWRGPRSGPAAQPGRTIALVAEDLRNGGIVGVAQGVREAAQVLGWTVKVVNAGGTAPGRAKALAAALAMSPDGLVLCGSDALENLAGLAPFARRGVPIVGWHAGSMPGPIGDTPVAMNVTTDPLQVARATAMTAVAQSHGRANVVIFTDSRYRIAVAKSDAMAAVVRGCAGCSVLEVRDVALSTSDATMPAITRELLLRHGKRWTHALAINDIVFDYAIPALVAAGLPSDGLNLLSAGDGSASAFLRIQARAFQTATVAEPLNQQGWQLLDELNRLFASQPVSGFVAPVHLVTADNIGFDGGPRLQYDPDNGYRAVYRRIWQR
ncbi:MAG TPA: substrate-binding domain-containing protein [Burkholderiaceae bacterium]|nr:substrate-binding domain-containing protein [Burkholderiaceae bacterium]